MENAEQAYYDSLQRFGEANQDNAATFMSLAQTNSHMANNMSNDIRALQQQMSQLLLAVNNRPPPVQPINQPYPQQTAYNMSPPPAYGQQSMNYQPPQQQYPPYNQQYQTYGGRGGRSTRGRGCGRGQGRGRGNYEGYQQPMGQQQYGQGGYNNMSQTNNLGFYGNQKPMNPVKFFKNWNYCWSCGYDVPDWHTSASCPEP